MKTTLDEELINYSDKLRGAYTNLLRDLSKIIALVTALIAALLVFVDIEFLGLATREFSTTLLLVLISSYVCYFSLEEAGERLYEDTDEHRERMERYKKITARITVGMLPQLREYLASYTDEELAFRQGQMLLSHGLSTQELSAYKEGELRACMGFRPTARDGITAPKGGISISVKKLRALRKIAEAKPLPLTPELLLTREARERASVTDPRLTKYPELLLKLLPGTLCMLLTASVVLTFREMTPEAIVEGVLKLSTLPIVCLRGYASGYNYKRFKEAPFIESKIRLLEGFLAQAEG